MEDGEEKAKRQTKTANDFVSPDGMPMSLSFFLFLSLQFYLFSSLFVNGGALGQ